MTACKTRTIKTSPSGATRSEHEPHVLGLAEVRRRGHREYHPIDRLEAARFDLPREGVHPAGIGRHPRHDGSDGRELEQVGHARPLLRRMSNMHRRRDCPVCCMQTRTGDSSSVGSGVSVGSVVTVTVGLGTSPWFSDQIVVLVPCSVEQYAVCPPAVVAVAPVGEHLAPIAATGVAGAAVVVAVVLIGGDDGEGGGCGGNGVTREVVDGVETGVVRDVACSSSALVNSSSAKPIATTKRSASTAGTMKPARSSDRRAAGVAAVACDSRVSPDRSSSPIRWAKARAKSAQRS